MKAAKGFASLAATVVLLVLSVLALLAVAEVENSFNAEERSRRTLDDQTKAWEILQKSVEAFTQLWNPAEQEWIDFARTLFPDSSVSFEDLSARINLNGLNTFVLQDSTLSQTLKGQTADAFEVYRTQFGPFSQISRYQDYFTPDSLAKLYCCYSVLNLNTVDELMAEKIATLRTGDPGIGSSLREKLRQARSQKKDLDISSTMGLFSFDDKRLGALFGLQSELNVNTAAPELVEALVTYPGFELPAALSKAQLLIDGRSSRRWTPETLAEVLGVEANAKILNYLGTQSSFLQGTVKLEHKAFRFVLYRSLVAANPRVIRVIQQGWLE